MLCESHTYRYGKKRAGLGLYLITASGRRTTLKRGDRLRFYYAEGRSVALNVTRRGKKLGFNHMAAVTNNRFETSVRFSGFAQKDDKMSGLALGLAASSACAMIRFSLGFETIRVDSRGRRVQHSKPRSHSSPEDVYYKLQ